MVEPLNRLLKRVPVLPLYFVCLVPAAWLLYQALNGMLGADPMRSLEHGLGIWSLRFMIAALLVTPLRELLGLSLIRFRRMLGLTAFWFALLHLATWIFLDKQLQLGPIVADLWKRPYIIFGMLAFLAMTPLALTSSDAMVRRLGALAWRKLHRLAYPAAVLMVLHYLWLVKSWTAEPLAYAAIMACVLLVRLRPKGGRTGETRGRARRPA